MSLECCSFLLFSNVCCPMNRWLLSDVTCLVDTFIWEPRYDAASLRWSSIWQLDLSRLMCEIASRFVPLLVPLGLLGSAINVYGPGQSDGCSSPFQAVWFLVCTRITSEMMPSVGIENHLIVFTNQGVWFSCCKNRCYVSNKQQRIGHRWLDTACIVLR